MLVDKWNLNFRQANKFVKLSIIFYFLKTLFLIRNDLCISKKKNKNKTINNDNKKTRELGVYRISSHPKESYIIKVFYS